MTREEDAHSWTRSIELACISSCDHMRVVHSARSAKAMANDMTKPASAGSILRAKMTNSAATSETTPAAASTRNESQRLTAPAKVRAGQREQALVRVGREEEEHAQSVKNGLLFSSTRAQILRMKRLASP